MIPRFLFLGPSGRARDMTGWHASAYEIQAWRLLCCAKLVQHCLLRMDCYELRIIREMALLVNEFFSCHLCFLLRKNYKVVYSWSSTGFMKTFS
jgi:hypothetical protein